MHANERELWLGVARKAGLVLGAAAAVWLGSFVFLDEPLFRATALVLLMGGLLIGIFDPGRFPTRRPNGVRAAVTGIFVALAVWQWIPPRPEAQMTWQPYSESAVQKAAGEGRPVMIDFSAEWCEPCHELDRRVFGKKLVVSAANKFVRLRADMTDQQSAAVMAVSQKYSVEAYPTVVFLAANGQEVANARLVGFESYHDFLTRIRSIP